MTKCHIRNTWHRYLHLLFASSSTCSPYFYICIVGVSLPLDTLHPSEELKTQWRTQHSEQDTLKWIVCGRKTRLLSSRNGATFRYGLHVVLQRSTTQLNSSWTRMAQPCFSKLIQRSLSVCPRHLHVLKGRRMKTGALEEDSSMVVH